MRTIDNGAHLHLEFLRHIVRVIRLKPTKDLGRVLTKTHTGNLTRTLTGE